MVLLSVPACKSDPSGAGPGNNPALVDTDGDGTPDQNEDRNQNGQVDPGETDPTAVDTDGDGILDDAEVSTLACAQTNDRPFAVYDMPGADSMLLVDGNVTVRSTLRTSDNKAPGGVFSDPDRGVSAVLVGKRPAQGVGTASAQRDYERRTSIEALGQIVGQRTRAFTTVEGFEAEQASFRVVAQRPLTSRQAANQLAQLMLNGVQLTGMLPDAPEAQSAQMVINLLTVFRGPARVVLVAAVAMGEEPGSNQLIRVEEFTDGTNVARHGSFTRHVCDQFIAEENAKADIIWVVDDSGSMEDDQEAVRAAADAMEEVLTSAQVDYRLGVARMFAEDENDRRRGRLEGGGFTRDLEEFKETIVVGADGGWEPGLETGILALDRLSPPTPAGAAEDEDLLREDAAPIIIFMSDERDQAVECAACGACDAQEGESFFCADPQGQQVIDRFVEDYNNRGATTFAIVGDLPTGCRQTGQRDDFEPGQGYVEVANATGGQFGSLCGDMRQNLEDVARAATGVASAYQLRFVPASATIRVAIGPAGSGRVIERSRENGFDYDAVTNKIIFFGDALPAKGDEVVVGYRRWDWANNPNTPGDPCDDCEQYTSCAPELDVALCQPVCGEEVCEGGQVCIPDQAQCGDPSDIPPDVDPCGGCDAGLVCDPAPGDCVRPCEETGCTGGLVCSSVTHLCQVPNF